MRASAPSCASQGARSDYIIVEPERAGHDGKTYAVGANGVTLIQPFNLCCEYAEIPYVRVWRGDRVLAEFSRHRLHSVFYGAKPHD